MELSKKVALITGSATRVGRHLAHALAAEGCDIAVHFNRSESAGEEASIAFQKLGVRAIPFRADLRNVDEIGRLFDEIDSHFGRLDILVNSAAILQAVDLLKVSPEDWQQTMGLNLKGAFFCLQFAARRMLAQESGAIVNISDVIGHSVWSKFPVHSISKAGVETLTRVAAITLAPQVRVNAIAPGLILKPDHLPAQRWETLAQKTPLQRSGTPTDLSDALLFLLKNDFVTGEVIVLDGGLSLTM